MPIVGWQTCSLGSGGGESHGVANSETVKALPSQARHACGSVKSRVRIMHVQKCRRPSGSTNLSQPLSAPGSPQPEVTVAYHQPASRFCVWSDDAKVNFEAADPFASADCNVSTFAVSDRLKAAFDLDSDGRVTGKEFDAAMAELYCCGAVFSEKLASSRVISL